MRRTIYRRQLIEGFGPRYERNFSFQISHRLTRVTTRLE
jgi:hypothetical protein